VSAADARARSDARERRGVAFGVDRRNDAADEAGAARARARRGNTSEARAPSATCAMSVNRFCASKVGLWDLCRRRVVYRQGAASPHC